MGMTNTEDIITRPYSQRNMDYAHTMALVDDAERAAQIVMVTASGLVITRGMLDEEIRSMKAPRVVVDSSPVFILGVNASSNMFA